MMKPANTRASRIAALGLTPGLAAAPAAAQQTIDKVNGSITAESGQTYGNLATVNGSITIESGARTDDASTVNGGIGLVDTDLSGGIETVSGDVTVGVGSHVKGGIKVEKPSNSWMPIQIGKRTPLRIVIGPNAVVEGPLVFEREVRLYVHSSAKIGKVTGATPGRYSTPTAPAD